MYFVEVRLSKSKYKDPEFRFETDDLEKFKVVMNTICKWVQDHIEVEEDG